VGRGDCHEREYPEGLSEFVADAEREIRMDGLEQENALLREKNKKLIARLNIALRTIEKSALKEPE